VQQKNKWKNVFSANYLNLIRTVIIHIRFGVDDTDVFPPSPVEQHFVVGHGLLKQSLYGLDMLRSFEEFEAPRFQDIGTWKWYRQYLLARQYSWYSLGQRRILVNNIVLEGGVWYIVCYDLSNTATLIGRFSHVIGNLRKAQIPRTVDCSFSFV